MVPKRPHDAYDMNAKVNALWGNIATKEKEIRETENPQEHNAFHKENSLGRQRLWGDKRVMRRPGYDLKLLGDWRNSIKVERLSRGNRNICGETSRTG